MLTSLPPYFSKSTSILQENIINQKLKFPSDLSSDWVDLLGKLLSRDPSKRLGSKNGINEILSHKWFKGITLKNIIQKELKPYDPYMKLTVRLFTVFRLKYIY